MVLKFGDVELLGPFSRLDELEDQPGLFVILCYKDVRFEPLDVRIAKLVQTEVARALAEPNWTEICTGRLRIGVLYSFDEAQLDSIKQQLLCEVG